MSEGSASHGKSRSRPVLGDVTNRIAKRGFSGIEKDGVKRICVSPRPCSEINSLKGNVISGLSKIPNENRKPSLQDDGDGLNCLKEKNDGSGNLKFHDGRDKDKIVDLNGANAVTQSVNGLGVVDNDSGDGCGETKLFNNIQQMFDEVAVQNRVDSDSVDIDLGVFWNVLANDANDCSTLDSLKKNKVTGNAEVAGQNRVDPNLADIDLGTLWNTLANGFNTLDSSKENKITGNAEVAKENRCSSIDFGIHAANAEANSELGDGSRADTSRTVSETGNVNEETCEENISPEGTQSELNDRHNDLDDHNAENIVMSQTGSVDCTLLPQSQESRVFGIDKCNGCAHMTVGTDAIKSCSCSFCTKAAYIWLDLHQKDIKARTSALKKSQRDASILAERSCRIKINEKHGAESATRANKLESHLVHQWKSLFQHMADIWEAESNQLDASLLPLNNLKDRCKAEMELMNAKPSEKN